jgi:hypothetical protein
LPGTELGGRGFTASMETRLAVMGGSPSSMNVFMAKSSF